MSAGVYRLEHLPTRRFYVGSSVCLEDRRGVWMSRLRRLCGDGPVLRPVDVSERFWRGAMGTRLSDWQFVVIEARADDVSRGALIRAELVHIARSVRDFPDLCLNSWAPGQYDRRRLKIGRGGALKRPGSV